MSNWGAAGGIILGNKTDRSRFTPQADPYELAQRAFAECRRRAAQGDQRGARAVLARLRWMADQNRGAAGLLAKCAELFITP